MHLTDRAGRDHAVTHGPGANAYAGKYTPMYARWPARGWCITFTPACDPARQHDGWCNHASYVLDGGRIYIICSYPSRSLVATTTPI